MGRTDQGDFSDQRILCVMSQYCELGWLTHPVVQNKTTNHCVLTIVYNLFTMDL
jgi:hypothetical protein